MARIWLIRLGTFLVWAAAAFAAVFWAMKQVRSAPSQPVMPVLVGEAPQSNPVSMLRVLGNSSPKVQPPAAAASAVVAPIDPASRFALLGVVAERRNAGVALIAIDGKPARPYQIGAKVGEEHKLRSVRERSAVLTAIQGGANLTLDLPGQTATRAAATASSPGTKLSN